MSILAELVVWNREMNALANDMARESKVLLQGHIQHSSPGGLLDSTQKQSKRFGGMVNRVGIQFARHGWYVEHGAGKGQGGKKGSHWQNSKGQSRYTNQHSLGRAGTGNRKAKKFVEPVLDKYVVIVADRAAALAADMVLDLVMDGFPAQSKRK